MKSRRAVKCKREEKTNEKQERRRKQQVKMNENLDENGAETKIFIMVFSHFAKISYKNVQIFSHTFSGKCEKIG